MDPSDTPWGDWKAQKSWKNTQPKEEKPKNKDAPWPITANYWVDIVFARFLGILGTQIWGIGREKIWKNQIQNNTN